MARHFRNVKLGDKSTFKSRSRSKKAVLWGLAFFLLTLVGTGSVIISAEDLRDSIVVERHAGEIVTEQWDDLSRTLSRQKMLSMQGPFQVTVVDRAGEVRYSKNFGNFNNENTVPVASAGKWVGTAVIMSVVDRGLLNLESTTSKVLGWQGENGKITLRELLSLTSGLYSESEYVYNPQITLQQCAEKLKDLRMASPPGARFEYGSTHLSIAAAMAEKVTGKSFNQILQENIRAPLGLTEATAFYADPEKKQGAQNAAIAGGLTSNTAEYLKFLAMIFNRGKFGEKRVLTEQAVAAMEIDQFQNTTLPRATKYRFGNFFLNFHYGLGNWRECHWNENADCKGESIYSSLGYLGWYPWVDRKYGYYALISTAQNPSGFPPLYLLSSTGIFKIHNAIVAAARKNLGSQN